MMMDDGLDLFVTIAHEDDDDDLTMVLLRPSPERKRLSPPPLFPFISARLLARAAVWHLTHFGFVFFVDL